MRPWAMTAEAKAPVRARAERKDIVIGYVGSFERFEMDRWDE